ncbi:MAG TPA: PAS domain-containing protein [Rhizomicrobium sp.]|nr:PAS domain-containing protein [Rhizomicrobium sp.]
MPDAQSVLRRRAEIDFRLIFDLTPGMCLILDTSFNIVAQNEEHARATLTTSKNVVGRWLFEVFPDKDDSRATGVSLVRQSLLNVLATRTTDVMPITRFDIQTETGEFQARYWAITNTPVLGPDGFVAWIINRAQDVTDYVLSGVGKLN